MGTEKWRNVRTEWRQRAQDLDQGEESFKWNWKHMKSVFFWCPNAHRLATSYKGTIRVRQAEREREGDSETTWEETKTTSLILPLQFSITKIVVTCKSDPQFRPFVGLSSAPSFVSISRQKTKDKRKKEGDQRRSEAIPLFSASLPHVDAWVRKNKKKRKKNPDAGVNAQWELGSESGPKWSRSDVQVTREQSKLDRELSVTHSVLRYVYSVEVCH